MSDFDDDIERWQLHTKSVAPDGTIAVPFISKTGDVMGATKKPGDRDWTVELISSPRTND